MQGSTSPQQASPSRSSHGGEPPAKRRAMSALSPSANGSPSNTHSPNGYSLRRHQVQKIDAHLDEEAEESSSDSEEDQPTPRPKYRRESAEVAKKKITKDVKSSSQQNGEEKTEKNEPNEPKECNCEKQQPVVRKRCCLEISKNCIKENREVEINNFHHITKGEHICQPCYLELWKPGLTYVGQFTEWKLKWATESRCKTKLKSFVQDQILPYWLRCRKCTRFRCQPLDPCGRPPTKHQIAAFECANCKEPEDELVSLAKNPAFMHSFSTLPYLQNSPTAHFLRLHYFFDEVGLSPIVSDYELTEQELKTRSFLYPFHIPEEQSMAFCFRPDVMEYDEHKAFHEFNVENTPYLAVRNLIVTLWTINPYKYLSVGDCVPFVLCRGLSRIWYLELVKRIHAYLEMKGAINFGIVDFPKPVRPNGAKKQLEVVVIGGGISGLTAARQLRSMGAVVKLLEAKSHVGGRMQDDWSLGTAVGQGAQLVTGTINNPIILMCEQLGVNYRQVGNYCPLVDAKEGGLVDARVDRKAEEHFNCVLDGLFHWKTNTKGEDKNLYEQLLKVHTDLLKKSGGVKWTETEERVFNWQIGNLEFACGAKLDKVSWRNFDQNESVALFAGAHALLTDGSGEIIKRLAEGTDIRASHVVDRIEWGSERQKVAVYCKNGKKYQADKVLLAVPLAVLQKEHIKFRPLLPEQKRTSINMIGTGLIEKVAVRFPRRFWSSLQKKDGTLDYFSHVPTASEERGLFNMFYDFSTKNPNAKTQSYVLMSYVCGDSVNVVNEKSDLEVVRLFCRTLARMFPHEQIPEPIGHVVTHWGRDPHIGMSYSFVKEGANGVDYDIIAQQVNDRLYFCGESTNRFFPQTMTGAYVSGLREAGKIIGSYRAESASTAESVNKKS